MQLFFFYRKRYEERTMVGRGECWMEEIGRWWKGNKRETSRRDYKETDGAKPNFVRESWIRAFLESKPSPRSVRIRDILKRIIMYTVR